AIVKDSNPPIEPGSDTWNEIADQIIAERNAGTMEYMEALERKHRAESETVSQAADAWFAEMQRTNVRPQTLDGHKLRVRTFVQRCGDLPLASITRAMASDFLTSMTKGRANRTVNNYATTLQCLFKSARNRGRFQGENPFEDQRRKAGGEKREAFTAAELHKIFASLPPHIPPAKHSPQSALPSAGRLAAYTGMRLEEISQLTVADIQTRGSNGGTVIVFDIHNGDDVELALGGVPAQRIERRASIAPLSAADAVILVDPHHLPASAFCRLAQLMLLVGRGLVLRGYP